MGVFQPEWTGFAAISLVFFQRQNQCSIIILIFTVCLLENFVKFDEQGGKIQCFKALMTLHACLTENFIGLGQSLISTIRAIQVQVDYSELSRVWSPQGLAFRGHQTKPCPGQVLRTHP